MSTIRSCTYDMSLKDPAFNGYCREKACICRICQQCPRHCPGHVNMRDSCKGVDYWPISRKVTAALLKKEGNDLV